MKPGRELDKLVAEAMGYTEIKDMPEVCIGRQPDGESRVIPYFSVDLGAAMKAFEWLEENHPWQIPPGRFKAQIMLAREGDDREHLLPSVIVMREHCDYGLVPYEEVKDSSINFYISGESYPHAIALAIVEAAKVTTL